MLPTVAFITNSNNHDNRPTEIGPFFPLKQHFPLKQQNLPFNA